MPERDYRLYLLDIQDSGRAIQSYVADIDFERFRKDRMRCAAAIREFEVIGEAVGKLPEEFKARYPQVAWREIKDFRNLLIHAYFGVDLRIVWNTIEQDLPKLLSATAELLAC